MPHNHDHSHGASCADESHVHDHDHSHESPDAPADNLFARIDHPNVVALNCEAHQPAKILKAWHQRMDESIAIESDADDQMILRVPFTGVVKLKSVLIKAGPGEQTPTRVALYVNDEGLDFDDVAAKPSTQEFEMVQSRDVGEYQVKAAKFSNVTCVTLFFPAAQGADTINLYYVGFMGTWTESKKEPIVAVFETQANLSDHEKIQGMDGAMQSPPT
ncbi:DUF1000-domain-containing protein [Exidia glandulosa HHB12029]|uniref:DUF1000-domain-containing protein n=1 Tax=Exidia glandulosa HHB12029 TaxID=1314781 RepID=A0A165EL65_EXIGL|nr:DUF1000-domain-containing protein [Exidia glandulosa HHB12029]